MPEAKSADTDRMDAVTATAVMPCVGGFIFYVGQSRIEDRPDFENQNVSTVVIAKDADRKRIG